MTSHDLSTDSDYSFSLMGESPNVLTEDDIEDTETCHPAWQIKASRSKGSVARIPVHQAM